MKDPFKNINNIPIEIQKQLAFPHGKNGESIGKSLMKGSADVIDKSLTYISFKENLKICDVGCGPGYSLIHLANKLSTGEIVGIDPSDIMCKQAREHTQDINDAVSIQIIQDKTPRLALESDYFDYVLLINIVYFWHRNEVTNHIKEIYRITKIHGKIILYATDSESLQESVSEDEGIYTIYSEEDIIQLLEHIGFKDIETHTFKRKIDQMGTVYIGTK